MLNITIKKDYFAYIDTDDFKLSNLIMKSFSREEKQYNNFFRVYETVNKTFYTLVNNGSTIKVKAGLIPFLCNSLHKRKIKYTLIDERLTIIDNITPVVKLNDEVELYDYQITAVNSALNKRFCTLQLPTGTGKTEISASIIRTFLRYYGNTAFVYAVPTCMLKSEAEKRFKDYGIKVNTDFPIKIGYVNILTFAALTRASKQKFDYKQRDSIGAVIWDEAHHLSATKLSKVVHLFHNLRLCIGVSATISNDLENKSFLNQLNSKEMLVYGCTGKLAYKFEIDDAIEKNFVTSIEVHVVENKLRQKLSDDEYDWQIIKDTLLKSKDRAELISGYTYHIVKEANLNTVVLLIPEINWSKLYMNSVANTFYDELNKGTIRVFELYGGNVIIEHKKDNVISVLSTTEEKNEALNAIRNPNIVTIFSATTFFFEGINITNIQAIINCYGGKDTKRVKQQCGRAMRLFNNKNIAYIHEIKDIGNPVLESQFRKRISVYKQEYNADIFYSTFKK